MPTFCSYGRVSTDCGVDTTVDVDEEVVAGGGCRDSCFEGFDRCLCGACTAGKEHTNHEHKCGQKNYGAFHVECLWFFDISDLRSGSSESPSFTMVMNPAAPDGAPPRRFT